MKSPCWALLAGLAAFLLTGAPYQDKRTLQNEIEYIERNMYKAEKIGAKECAASEYAKAEAELTFAKIEFSEKAYWESKDHLDIAIEYALRALSLSRDCYVDSDGDGIYDRNDKCPWEIENYNGYVDGDGCPDSIPRRAIYTGDKIELLEPIVFTEDETDLVQGTWVLVADILKVLFDIPDIRLRIEGHLPPGEDSDEVTARSERRAAVVVDTLIEHGISPDRLLAKGMGSSSPLVPNNTEKGREINERIEFVVIQP